MEVLGVGVLGGVEEGVEVVGKEVVLVVHGGDGVLLGLVEDSVEDSKGGIDGGRGHLVVDSGPVRVIQTVVIKIKAKKEREDGEGANPRERLPKGIRVGSRHWPINKKEATRSNIDRKIHLCLSGRGPPPPDNLAAMFSDPRSYSPSLMRSGYRRLL